MIPCAPLLFDDSISHLILVFGIVSSNLDHVYNLDVKGSGYGVSYPGVGTVVESQFIYDLVHAFLFLCVRDFTRQAQRSREPKILSDRQGPHENIILK